MLEIIRKFAYFLSFPFVRYAFICGVLISVCSSLLGTTLVLKRFSFIGDGLSHVAFGALAIATVLHVTRNMLVVLPVTVICAIFLLRLGKNTGVKGDAAVAMLSVTALATGYLLLNIFPVSSNISGDVCSTLFGSTLILTLGKTDVIVSVVLSAVTVLFFVLFYNRIFSVTFDEGFSSATGTRAKFINLASAVIIAVVIVLAMNLVGSLLISALVVFPALSAMRVFKSFRSVTICSAALSAGCTLTGLAIAVTADTPVGATIVATQAVAFLIFLVIGKIKG
ncbi:MAG: metal ABC transporter permease [Clostridia bacterium]|nr:metal ABC transporter permease [Clostridia bacterium]